MMRSRCPHCLQGEVFTGLFKMHRACPLCGIEYEREHGFFAMSMFFGYAIGFMIELPICIVLYLLDAPLEWYIAAVVVSLILLSPFLFRYARILWLHLDELMDPRPE
jgi:uncharacterized protein (DUF983 family)